MTDLELTKLCAEAMSGHSIEADLFLRNFDFTDSSFNQYDPLHNDAQAMALVKKFTLSLCFDYLNYWKVWFRDGVFEARHKTDLNRAIVECVTKMQAAKAHA